MLRIHNGSKDRTGYRSRLTVWGIVAGLMITGCGWPGRVLAARVDALTGDPFGVAEITVPFPAQDVGQFVGPSGYQVTEPNGRVFYPAFNQGFLKRLMGQNAPPPANVTVLVLFRGTEPFEVTVRTPTPQTLTVTPRSGSARAVARLLRKWWRYFNAFFREQAELGDHPPIVGTYLSSMLARRLALPAPLLDRLVRSDQPSEDRQILERLIGTERMRLATLRAASLGQDASRGQADLPVPASIEWLPVRGSGHGPPDQIEVMAMHVPEECFYVRFGNFRNYIWLSQLLEDSGGDLASMITARGYQDLSNQRIQRQLGLKQTALAEVLGPTVISDVALIGRDTYVREGAAVGILFEARNPLLGVNLAAQRTEALSLQKDRGGTGATVQIAGRDVSFFSTPDNRLRSFYAVDGDYHLVTTSRAIVERFYEAGQGKFALGANPEFHDARTLMPADRDDTVFVYLSSEFFQGLLDPHYQIELARRLAAVTDIELIKMARWAARHEGLPGDTIDQLTAGRLLPAGFGRRPDESGPIVMKDRIIDSLRGAQGTFTPIPDISIRGVTRSEQQRVAAETDYLAENWRKMDPLIVAIKRYALDDQRLERITVDSIITPMDEMKYQWLISSLGEPTDVHLVPPAGNIISMQASLRGGLLVPEVPPHLMFVGVQDHLPLADLRSDDLLKTLQIVRSTPGYLGAWPKPGFLDMLPFQLGSMPDAAGMSRLPLGVWRWQDRGYSVLSLDQGILTQVSQQLTTQQADDLAQIRVHVGNLAESQCAEWISRMTYERARQVSVGNARLLNILTQQLGVPRDQALSATEDLLDAQLICSLGGDYELAGLAESPLWQSTAWPDSLAYAVPTEYQSALLAWFRGLNASLTKDENRMFVRAHLDVQRKLRESSVKLPSFNVFGSGKQKRQAETDD